MITPRSTLQDRFLLPLLTAILWLLLTPMLAQASPAFTADSTQLQGSPVSAADSMLAQGSPASTLDSAQVVQRADAAQDIPKVTVYGEVRSRTEMDGLNGASTDLFTYLRSRLGARMDLGEGARLAVTVQDSRVLGAEGHPSAAAGGRLALQEGYLELVRSSGATSWGVKAGRQVIALGNERLVGGVNWSNTGRSFDGLRVTVSPSDAGRGWAATVFGAVMEERGRRFGDPAAVDADDHLVFGAHSNWTLGAALLDATIVHDVAGTYRSFSNVDRSTLDARLRVPSVSGVRFELEGAYQFGRQQWQPAGSVSPMRQDIGAWLAGARVGTASPIGRLTSATVGVDVLSGDDNAADDSYGAFNTVYGTNHPFYGLMDVFPDPAARTGDRGLTDMFASAVVRLDDIASLRADIHSFRMNKGDDRNLGWELDLVAPVRVTSGSTVELGYSIFRASDGAALPGLDSGEWGYVQLRVGF
ncbi:MAG TPA: alginate export family protein [Gemmatimonadales bacterium]|nr:alginate export family protein [Gemmatimonadales bacterium]